MKKMLSFKGWFLFVTVLILGASSVAYAQWTDNGGSLTTSDNIGIGTTEPAANLHIRGGSGSAAVLRFQGTEPGTHQWEWRGTVNASNWGLMKLRNVTTDSDVFSVREDGNVGIGTSNPTSKLHVVGNATFTGTVTGGNIAAQYQDVAEWVPTSDSLASGTVVVIDPIKNNRVLPSAQPYDTRVAGVVSAQPGILLGEAGADKAKVAHSGRVKVKVDAQYGPIGVGDILAPLRGFDSR